MAKDKAQAVLFDLVSSYLPRADQPRAIDQLVTGLNDGLARQTLLGVTGAGKTFTIAHVIAKTQRPALILAPNKTLAAQFYGEMRAFFPNNAVEYFVSYYDYYQPEAYVPASDTFIEKDASINAHIEQMRLSATKAILERKDTIIVATVSAIYGLGDPGAYLAMVLHLSRGEQKDQRSILEQLTSMQYTRNDVELSRAHFRVHGDVIDVFPADSEREAIRIELFDDQIEALRFFDPLTGKVIRTVPRLTIFPKTHYVTPKDRILAAVEAIKVELKARLAVFMQQEKRVEHQRLDQRTRYDLEMMVELGYCTGIENYSRYLSGRAPGDAPPTLMDYLPPDVLLVIDESHVTVSQLGAMYKGDRARKENLVNYGFRLPSAMDNRPLRFDEFEHKMPQTIFVSATPAQYEKNHSEQVVEMLVRPTGLVDPEVIMRPVANQVDDLLGEIKERVALAHRVLVTTLTKRMAEDLTEYLHDHGVRCRYLHSDIDTVERVEIIRDLRMGAFDVLIGINLLREGLDLPEVALVAILDADKEGFLRSERSLIQTIGRAARHLQGTAILYADKKTKAIEAALSETTRRRKLQMAYNKKHGITPTTIKKAVRQLIETDQTHDTPAPNKTACVAVGDGVQHSKKEVLAQIKVLEKEMFSCAQQLEFEKAATIRDQIEALRAQWLTLPG